MTLSVIRKLSKYIYLAGMQSVRILPYVAIYNIAMKRGLLPSDFSWFKHYTNEVDSQASNSYYNTIPLYLEHMSQAEIIEKLNEFDKIVSSRFSNFYNIKRALKSNLKMDTLKGLTLNDLKRKTNKTFVMLKSAYSNRRNLRNTNSI